MAQSSPKIDIKEMEVVNIVSTTTTVGTDSTPSNNVKLHRGGVGQLEVVSGDDATSEGSRSPNKVQVNVKNALIGTNATLINNVKLHRCGNGELGFVLGDDATSEGSRSSSNATIQSKAIVIGDSPNQSFNAKIRRAGNGLVQFVLGSDSSADGTFSPNYADVLGSVPVGSVVAWNPGYFLDAANGTFVNASFLGSNNVAGANAYLNPRGFYVADGGVPNVTGSLIWNASGRYLPNLTDARFLMGNTSAGSIGGSNVLTDHTHTFSLTVDAHTHSINHDHLSFTTASEGNHNHTVRGKGGTGGTDLYLDSSLFVQGTSLSVYLTTAVGALDGAHTHSIDVPSYTGTSGGSSSNSISGTVGTGNVASSTENRPKYLSTFYIVRVF